MEYSTVAYGIGTQRIVSLGLGDCRSSALLDVNGGSCQKLLGAALLLNDVVWSFSASVQFTYAG